MSAFDPPPFEDAPPPASTKSPGAPVSAFDPLPQPQPQPPQPPTSYTQTIKSSVPMTKSEEAKEIKRRERLAMNPGPRAPNWPKCRPCIYHNISDEIEVPLQRTVRALYYSWFLVCVCVVINCVACLLILTSGKGASPGSDFGWSILYLAVLPPASFFLWYRPVYNAFMKDSSFYFFVFFIFNFFHIAFCIYATIGIPSTGCAGFMNTLDIFKDAKAEGTVCFVATGFWLMASIIHILLFGRVRKHYRRRGHSFAEARQQALTSAARSDTGKAVATAAVTSAATGYARQYDEV